MSGPQIDPSLYRERDKIRVRRALIAVSDKRGLVELATSLVDAGVELVSTGGTSAAIAAAGLPVTQVAEVTGYPEHLDGRVRTLHPAVHSGLLADLRLDHHQTELAQLGIKPYELVVVNLYPFAETVASGAEPNAVVEQIDIGGPAMVRASAKNHANVAVVVSPDRYAEIAEAVAAGGTTLEQRRELAREAFRHTASYDIAVASWMGSVVAPDQPADESPFPAWIAGSWSKDADLRYGENSHQRAALYAANGAPAPGIAQAEQLHGKEMSYNNYVDADAAVRAAFDFAEPAVAIIKHANPCGIAVAAAGASDPIADAHRRAHECDPVSAFGGVIAANRVVTREMAETVAGIFTEVLVAPGFEPEAVEVLTQKKNIRLLTLPEGFAPTAVELRQVSGGMLLQQSDRHFAPTAEWTLAAGEPADEATLADLAFAWTACRAVKSNAILLASGGASVGVGMGQVNRVDSCKLAIERAGERAAGSVAASDAFFPFADGPQILIDAGVRAIVQPGGSVRDDEVVAAAKAAGVTMYFTGERHFFH
ncbi:bifunctional phosphoribosylaminoimidazolecarboxamide formyltransferase/IMP cyclohydrolase [Agromyces aerolatus]|uniref:bifunctional phosphoribosylaminoimidazolecarboxamide formyltransferase/IMP cyclohydrolase n=1 Tax=Agromyces sp. LY-1074 TaxID=3074080 RepID=UPI0028563E1A|nr:MULTISPECIES: bifunctional phosphoribosylaminoimidazolecarboxamide formyltransferase/IMP cyclohydrolase [unclassified Agromyces]MDR5698305.1 bifunctional phosphoribosylaminoimidazolecarboxamide formyltransferase/IMP cyclohydrolase [Agromyces sp. LY-1074]MDR5704599.1 bifunctional phosphoribosylaminoimidazolecarboxamide formyltransferase/IMP cyclohydrolase [Agromyces sp. LY-1358]